jgi:two-component system, LytTR family, response regulator LytT
MSLRVAIVDDEAPARSELRYLLGAHAVEVVAEAAGAAEAVRVLESAPLDVVFLDVEMPGADGIALARALAQKGDAPAVVFVTAHADYAVEAFAVEAFDYLVKPVDPERLGRVLDRLEARERRGATPLPGRIPVVAGGGLELLELELIVYVSADGDYSRVHTFDRSYLSTASLRELEESLPTERFARVHRSYLVNLAKVSAVRRVEPDRLRLALDDAQRTELDVARRQTRRVRELLGL